MTQFLTNAYGWASRTTKNVCGSVCTKGASIAGYLHVTSSVQTCATKATQCWTDHNSELKYAIVAGSTALLTSGWGIMPLIAGGGAFAVTKGFKHRAAAVDAVANGLKNQQRAVSNFVVQKTQKTRNFIHCWRSTNEQIHAEIVAAMAAKNIAKLLTLSKYIHLLTEDERSNAVIAFSKTPELEVPPALEAGKEELLSSLLNGTLNPAAINDGLKFAIQQNKPDLIKILLKNNELTHPQLLTALKIACTPGTSTEVINELLSQGIARFTEEERSAAVSELLKLPLTAEKEVILSSLLNCTLNTAAINAGLKFAIQQTKPNLIRILLENNNLTEAQLIIALSVASTSAANDEVINTLLSQGINPITDETADKFKPALLNIAGRGFEKAFQTLLNIVNFTPEQLFEALNAVISHPENNKKVDFITVLNDKIPADARIKEHSCAFALSMENNELLEFLLSKEPPLTPDQLSRLIIHATTLSYTPFIERVIFFFLNNPDISDSAKSKTLPLFVDAVNNSVKNFDDFSTFIQTITRINEADRKKAILKACMHGRTDVLNRLLQNFPINRQFKNQLLDVCHISVKEILKKAR